MTIVAVNGSGNPPQGYQRDDAITWTAIAKAESGENSAAHNLDGEALHPGFDFSDTITGGGGDALLINADNVEWPIGPIPSLETTIVHDGYWL